MFGTLSENLKELAKACPYPLYIVGGRVRDFLAGLRASETDSDICAPASAEDFIARARSCGFSAVATYKNTGAVKLEKDGEAYEFTSFRSDRYVRGEHVPAEVFFTDDIELDARRRDFKCNAVYYDISGRKFEDPLGGIADIERGIISTVAPPEKVFGEDGLRLMRLARISAQTGFVPDESCLAAARGKRELIKDVSAERVFAELRLILTADLRYGVKYAQYRGLKILKDIGVLGIILPELCLGDKMAQRSDFHSYDVLEHSLRTVMYADPSVRLAALLHDIGKPACFSEQGNFHGHEKVGSEIAGRVCARLKVPVKESETVVRLTALHMYDSDCRARENKVRKFIVENYDVLDKLLLLKQADYSACKDDLEKAPSVEKTERILNKMKAEGAPLTLKQLNIRGDALIRLGFPPREVGETLNKLLIDCCTGRVENDEEKISAFSIKVYGPKGR